MSFTAGRDTVTIEGARAPLHLNEPDTVEVYRTTSDHLKSDAFGLKASLSLLNTIAKELMNSNDLDPTWLQNQLTGAQWHTASSGGQSCVEVAFLAHGIVALRDSKNPDKPAHWSTVVGGALAGLPAWARSAGRQGE